MLQVIALAFFALFILGIKFPATMEKIASLDF